MVQSLHARWQFLIVALLAMVASACVLLAAEQRCAPLRALELVDHNYACADQDTSAQHSGTESQGALGADERDDDDEELSAVPWTSALFGPRAMLRTLEPACLAPRLPPQTQLERPPRA